MECNRLADDVLKASLLVEKYSMVTTQIILGTVATVSALDFAGRAIALATGSTAILKNVQWISSVGTSLGLPALAIHVLAISLILLFGSALVKIITSAYLNRRISWENWRVMRPDITFRCE